MYKKQYKTDIIALQRNKNNFFLKGNLALKNLKLSYINSNQLESIRRLLIRKLKKSSVIIIRMFCLLPITEKSVGTRMGKGAGGLKTKIFYLKKGTLFIELFTLNKKITKSVLKQIQMKYNFKSCLINRNFFFKKRYICYLLIQN